MAALANIIFFMPAIVSLIWTLSFLVTKRTYRQNVLLGILVAMTASLIANGFYNSSDDYYQLVTLFDQVSVPLALWCTAAMCLYIWIFISRARLRLIHAIAFLPAIIFATVHTTLFYVIGRGTVELLFRSYDATGTLPPEYDSRLCWLFLNTNYYVSTFLCACFIVCLVVLCGVLIVKEGYRLGDLFRFMFKEQYTSTVCMVAFFTMLISIATIGRMASFFLPSSIPSLIFSIIQALALHFMCFAEHNSRMGAMNIDDVAHLHDFGAMIQAKKDYDEVDIDCTVNESDEDDVLDDDGDMVKHQYARSEGIMSAFKDMMEKEQVFLDTDVSIIDVAKRLNIGRSTLSMYINNEYQKNFRAVINDYRIDFAKQYMRQNPTMTQEQVAFMCGFKDASAFSRKFKEIIGMPPAVWLMSEK